MTNFPTHCIMVNETVNRNNKYQLLMGPRCMHAWVGFLKWPSKVTFEARQKLTKYVFVPNSTSELHQWNMYLGFLKDNVPGLRQTYILHNLFGALHTNFVHNLLHPKLIGGTVKDCLPWGKWQQWLQVSPLKSTLWTSSTEHCVS
jgi:hypothetical protein